LPSLNSLTTGARVHRRDKLKSRRQSHRPPSTRQANDSLFQGLPQQVQNRRRELPELV
jgi:hypothetical protein